MKTLFYNGKIITFNNKEYDSILVNDEIIEDIGFYSDFKNINCQTYDLEGKTVIPAFIDAHSHLSSYANSMLQVSLENATNHNDIKEYLIKFIKDRDLKDDEWIIANAYDDNNLEEGKINKNFLDKVSLTNPIVVQHKNGHNGVFNSKAIKLLNIITNDGILEEKEYMEYIKKVPMANFNDLIRSYDKAQQEYLKRGIVQIQEGILVKEMLPIYDYLINNDLIYLDTVVYPDLECYDIFKNKYPQTVDGYYHHIHLGGIKIILDGSPQSKTAWMLTNYVNSNTCGYGVMSDKDICSAIEKCLEDNVQLIAHCNGDAAINQYLTNLEKYNLPEIRKMRPVIIHAQLLNLNQLEQVKRLGVIPSFFVGHVYHFGDIHIRNFGIERAKIISPTKSCLDKNILFTFHQDTPVIEPNILETLWIATNRITKDGVVLGSDECINVNEALKAQTINVAYQYHEENIKGSLEKGKMANFLILDKDLTGVNKKDIRNIRIIKVVYHGKLI